MKLKGPIIRALKDSSSAIAGVVKSFIGDVARVQVAKLCVQFAAFRAEHPGRGSLAPAPTLSWPRLRRREAKNIMGWSISW